MCVESEWGLSSLCKSMSVSHTSGSEVTSVRVSWWGGKDDGNVGVLVILVTAAATPVTHEAGMEGGGLPIKVPPKYKVEEIADEFQRVRGECVFVNSYLIVLFYLEAVNTFGTY